MKATAVLPVKRFGEAKQRLAAGIDDERRVELAEAMLEDALEAIAAPRSIERTIVVTGEPRAGELGASGRHAEVLSRLRRRGPLGGGAGRDRPRPRRTAPDCVVLLPIDCPLLEPRELDRLLTGVPESYVAVVPDRHGTGTNALALAPPGAIRPAFGEGSCARHVAAAREAGIPFSVEELPSLALDLDTPADVVALTRELAAQPSAAEANRQGTGDMSELRSLSPSPGLPEFTEGMRIGELIAEHAELADGDVVVVSQKIVSKAEGRIRRLSSVLPGAEARRLAAALGKEPALVELILEESRRGAAGGARRADRRNPARVRLRQRRDRQLQPARAGHRLACCPRIPTPRPVASARRSATPPALTAAVIVSDSFGRAWRLGQAEVAIGCAGIAPLDDWRGRDGRRADASWRRR